MLNNASDNRSSSSLASAPAESSPVGPTRSGSLLRNTAWAFAGQGTRLIIQAAYFVVIARSLGAGNYGEFIGISALMAILSPFAGNGAGQLLVKHAACDREHFPVYWGNGLVMMLGSGLSLAALAMALGPFLLPRTVPLTLILIISLTDIPILNFGDLAAKAYQSVERLDRYAQLTALPTITRLIAAVVVSVTVRHPTALQWGYFYLASTLAASGVALFAVCIELDSPRFALRRIPGEMADGFFFALSESARSIYNDIDKTMLVRISTLTATGIYGAAYRLIEVSFAPTKSLLQAAYPRFFQHGREGIANSFSFGKRLVRNAGALSLLICVALLAGAPVIPYVLGKEYADCVDALRWLSLLPLLKTVHHLMADTLTGAGYQRLRTALQVTVAVANVLINRRWIPAYGWRGAAWSSLVSDGVLAAMMYSAASLLARAQSQREAQIRDRVPPFPSPAVSPES
jgi:O-antigen/teichoic acid export membrane protein